MKLFLLIFLLSFCSTVYSQGILINENNTNQVNHLKEDKLKLRNQIDELTGDLDSLIAMTLDLNTNIKNNLIFQQKLQESSTKLLELIRTEKEKTPKIEVQLLQSTNLYVFVLPVVTIFIVLGSTYLSLNTLKIKSQESLDAIEKSNQNQLDINKKNNENLLRISQNSNENQLYISEKNNEKQLEISLKNNELERVKSQEVIISSNRQEWINTLRDDLALLASNLTRYMVASKEQRVVIFSDIWHEFYKVQLLLNPKEDLHNNLIEELDDIIELCSFSYEVEEFKEKRDIVLAISKKILKEEWKRVKLFK